MGRSSIFVLEQPLPVESTALGRFERWITQPGHQGFDPRNELSEHPHIRWVVSEVNNVSKLLNHSHGIGLQIALTNYASVFFKGGKTDTQKLEALQGFQYVQMDVDRWFKCVCESPEVQEWLEDQAFNKKKIYMVTGIRTLSNARVDKAREYILKADAKLQAPLLAALGVPLSTPLDPGAEAHASWSHMAKFAVCFPGQMLFQLQYREVQLKADGSATLTDEQPKWTLVNNELDSREEDMNKNANNYVAADLLDGVDPEKEENLAVVAIEDEDYYYGALESTQ